MQPRTSVTVEVDDLLEMCKAARAIIELDKFHEKEHAARFIENRLYGYLPPTNGRDDFQEWIGRKGWLDVRPKETIILPG